MNDSDETVVANLLLLEAERKIDQLAKEVLALEAENLRLKRVIDEMTKPYLTKL